MKSTGMLRHRPSVNVPFPALKNKLRIELNPGDEVKNITIAPKNTRVFVSDSGWWWGKSAPENSYTIREVGAVEYNKTRYFPRSAIVIMAEIEENAEYIDIPAGTPVFISKTYKEGTLPKFPPEFVGKAATVILNAPEPETIKECLEKAKEKTETE